MIYEFALDPSLVAEWSDRREFQRYKGRFGIGTARIMARVPKKHWRRLVWEAFDAKHRDDGPDQQRRRKVLTEILVGSLEAGMSERSCLDHTLWPDTAEREHAKRPFRALLVAGGTPLGPAGLPTLRDPDFDQDDALWSPEDGLVDRTPDAIVRALAPLLSCAASLRFVDPHFDPTKERWRRSISALLARAVERRESHAQPKVELHTCVTRGRAGRGAAGMNKEEKKAKAAELAAKFQGLKEWIPAGLPVSVFLWAERETGQEFHDRFLLTDVGGLQFGKGFDFEHEEKGRKETVTLLARKTYTELMRSLEADAGTFELLQKFELIGAHRIHPADAGKRVSGRR